jgi:hypothetical protein
MKNVAQEPILGIIGELMPRRPDRPYNGMVIKGGLRFICGNSKPHFSLTCSVYRNGRDEGGAADHERILRSRPHLKPLADLHLSDIDGVPMHAADNGWYWLAGTVVGGFGQRSHGGSGDWGKPADECLRIFAQHVRISLQEAVDLRERMLATAKDEGDSAARGAFDEWICKQRPRWKAEADACIQALDLDVFGSHWPIPEAAACTA